MVVMSSSGQQAAGQCQRRKGMAEVRDAQPPDEREAAAQGRLLARPQPPRESLLAGIPPLARGLHALGLSGADGRDCLLYVPTSYNPERASPLVLLLHGAGGAARGGVASLLPLADAAGMLLLAPDARLQSWDIVMGSYGHDVAFIDRALTHTFARYMVDSTHLAAGGFSDGASYALSLGLMNGDLFTHLIAFSPGFVAPGEWQGQPHIYISHGTRDQVLPINICGRRIAHMLRGDGYDVNYHEFDGPHTVPPEIAREAVRWFTS